MFDLDTLGGFTSEAVHVSDGGYIAGSGQTRDGHMHAFIAQ
jgi:hypothetical protein